MKSLYKPALLLTRPRRKRSLDDGLGMAAVQWGLAVGSVLIWWALCLLAASTAHAQVPDSQGLQSRVQALLAQQTVRQPDGTPPGAKPWRMEVEVGQLDQRLKLAPCNKVHAYMPDGAPLWGKTRVGLRCEQGTVHWNVFWPVTIKVWGQALVPVVPLRPGVPVMRSDLQVAEVDLAANPSPAVARLDDVVGRSVIRNVEPGHSIRQDDVKARRWFAAGDTVRLNVMGAGFQVAAEGTAMSHGDEGHCARVRTENGRVVCGMPVGERLVELAL